MAAENVVVTFGLKVEDIFDSFEGVQTKIKGIEYRTSVPVYKLLWVRSSDNALISL